MVRAVAAGAGDPPKCEQCGATLNDGEARTFMVCDDCWNDQYRQRTVPVGAGDRERNAWMLLRRILAAKPEHVERHLAQAREWLARQEVLPSDFLRTTGDGSLPVGLTMQNPRYVAIYKSRVVDEDPNLAVLTNRFFDAHPEWEPDDQVFFIFTCDEPSAGAAVSTLGNRAPAPGPPLYVYYGPHEGMKLLVFPELPVEHPVVLTPGDKLELRWVRAGDRPPAPRDTEIIEAARNAALYVDHASAFCIDADSRDPTCPRCRLELALGAVRPPPRAAPREPSEAALVAAFYAIYGRKGGRPTQERDGPELVAVEKGLIAAYAVDCGASPAAAP